MGNPHSPDLAQDFAAALDWWRLAGIDCDFADEATDWVAPAPQPEPAEATASPTASTPLRPAPEPQVARVAIGGDKGQWPTDLAAFHGWWLESDLLDAGGSFRRIAPRGNASAPLMVIVPEPEEVDRDRLLTGPEGRLLAGFLAAAGIAPTESYVAAALPRHTPLPDWAQLAQDGLGELLRHHVALVAPQRILAFGRNIPPLLGHDTAQAPAVLPNFNHDGHSVPVMGAASLGELLRSAGRRKQFWRRWLDWTEG